MEKRENAALRYTLLRKYMCGSLSHQINFDFLINPADGAVLSIESVVIVSIISEFLGKELLVRTLKI